MEEPFELSAALAAVTHDVSHDLVRVVDRRAWSALPADLRRTYRAGVLACALGAPGPSELTLELARDPPVPGLASSHVILEPDGAGAWPDRLLLGGFEHEPDLPPARGWAERLLGLLACAGHDQIPAALPRVLDDMPADVWLARAGSLRPRAIDAVRLVLSVPADRASGELARIDWPGDPALVRRLIRRAGLDAGRAHLAIDAGAAVGPLASLALLPEHGHDARAVLRRLAPSAAAEGWDGAVDGMRRRLGAELSFDVAGHAGTRALLAFS
ncbi:MAG: hypothetical protein KF729_38205 [Sandaracinaceae bacterium]|nr:hypothetical protein [Sandaracinaceae bacterium]